MNEPLSEVFLADCMDIMKNYPDKYFELAVVDPPYGENALDGSRTKNKYGINRDDNWDCYRPNKFYFDYLFRISKNQIIWGGNYFISDLKDTKCFIIWDKKIAEGMNNYAMCEMAWTSFNKVPAKIYSKFAVQNYRIHPMQKPIALYDWIFKKFAKEGDKIFDSHLGSQSSRISAYKAGLDFVGCEIDPDYFRDGCKRFDIFKSQLRLF